MREREREREREGGREPSRPWCPPSVLRNVLFGTKFPSLLISENISNKIVA
jgi:hypothetical protein